MVWLEIARLLSIGELTWLQGVFVQVILREFYSVITVITFGQSLVVVRIALICMIDVGRFSSSYLV